MAMLNNQMVYTLEKSMIYFQKTNLEGLIGKNP